jgi:multidrug efflux pump subunit AcrB
VTAGSELRNRTEGIVPAIYRQNGIEYDVRVMFDEDHKDLQKYFYSTYVPNQNGNMVPLSRVAKAENRRGYSQINRQNKGRYIAITANLGPNGQLGEATNKINQLLQTEMKPPVGITYRYDGQAQDFIDLISNMVIAMGLGVLLIYLVLSSLYESFVTPFTILLALPLAISGAFAALFLLNKTIDIFSIIGLILLMGVVAKNSILLVDYTKHLMNDEHLDVNTALIRACKTRLRPILMTSLALIAGMMPIAIGVTALGAQRQSMGVAIIGGVISSTLLSLVVVPAAFDYIERFRVWSGAKLQKLRGVQA